MLTGLLGSQTKSAKSGVVDAACLVKVRDKLDGDSKREKGCFARRDAAAIGGTLDAKIDGLVCALDPVRQLVPCE